MERNTLLYFLTQRANRVATREFNRVIADATANPDLKQDFEKLFRGLFKGSDPEKFYGNNKGELGDIMPKTDGEKFGNWIKNLGPNVKKLLKGKDPLDLTPSDLDNLFRVYRDPNEKIVQLKIMLAPNHLNGTVTPEQIRTSVAKFYNDNKSFFDSADKISYDPEKKVLFYEGSNFKLKELLEILKVKPDVQENILKQKQELEGTWFLPFSKDPAHPEAEYLNAWEEDERYWQEGKPVFQEFQKAVQNENDQAVRDGWLDSLGKWINNKGQHVYQFEGSLSDLKSLFAPILDDPGNRTIRQIKENASAFKRMGS